MAWNDGITKELSDWLNGLGELGDESVAIFKNTIDEAVDTYSTTVTAGTPVDTGALKASFTVEKIQGDSGYYGYNAYFKGENSAGESYTKIANVLNYGSPTIAGSKFVSNAVKKLKGLDDRIEANILDNLVSKLNEDAL